MVIWYQSANSIKMISSLDFGPFFHSIRLLHNQTIALPILIQFSLVRIVEINALIDWLDCNQSFLLHFNDFTHGEIFITVRLISCDMKLHFGGNTSNLWKMPNLVRMKCFLFSCRHLLPCTTLSWRVNRARAFWSGWLVTGFHLERSKAEVKVKIWYFG